MNTTQVNTKELISALKQCEAVADKKATMPILAYAKLTLDKGAIRLDATDLETAISLTISADVSPEHCGKQFYVMPDLWRSLTGETTRIQLLNNKQVAFDSLRVTSESFDEFPSSLLDREWLKESTEIHFPNVISRINSVSYAAGTDETRYNLVCVCLQQKQGTQVAIGCDGHRIAYDETLPAEGKVDDYEYLAPLKTAKILSKYSDIKDGFDVIKDYSLNVLRFSIPGGHIACIAIDGQYPDWRQVLPKEAYKVTFDSKELLKALTPLKAIKPAGGRRNKSTVIKVSHNCTESYFATKDDTKSLKIACPSNNDKAHEETVGLELKYLTDALKAYKGSVSLNYSESAAYGPVGIDSASSNVRAVIMPIRFE